MPQERKGISWLLHKYTDVWVEGLRLFMGTKRRPMPKWTVKLLGWPDSAMTKGKDMAYVVGHIIVYAHIPVILIGLGVGGWLLFA